MLVNGALVIQSGCHGSFVGRLDLDVEDGRIIRTAHRLIPVDASIAPEAAMTAMVDAVLAPHRVLLGAVVGHMQIDLHRNTILEATMDNLLLDAIAEAAETTIAFSNGWRYGAPVPQGPITRNDLWNMIPTNPPVSKVEMTGDELRCRPIPRRQLADAVDLVIGNAGEDVAQIGFGVEVVELGGFDEGVDGGGALTAGIGSCEEIVLAAESDAADGALGGVVVISTRPSWRKRLSAPQRLKV